MMSSMVVTNSSCTTHLMSRELNKVRSCVISKYKKIKHFKISQGKVKSGFIERFEATTRKFMEVFRFQNKRSQR